MRLCEHRKKNMTSIKGVPCFLFLMLGIIYNVHASTRSCAIPSGVQYRRSFYSPQYGSNISRYPAGRRINHGTKIRVICKKGVYHDIALSKCHDGRWVPDLPHCNEQKRCRAPPSFQHATASERITPYITFPHGTSVTYTCDVGKMATGSDTVVCKDGKWSDTSFQCEADPDFKPDTTTVPSSGTQRDTCSQLTIENGRISVKDMSNSTYDVTCNAGFRLRFAKTYRCRHGRWIGAKPECVRALARCKFPFPMRRGSVLRSNATGEVINAFHIDHWTRAVQTCSGNRRFANSRTVRCVNGRWRPGLMTCSHSSSGNRQKRTSGIIRHKRSESDCVIPNLRGGEAVYHNVTSGERNSYVADDRVRHGQIVQRECLEGIMLLPVVQFNTTMVTECDNGEWKPSFQRCLRDEKDTVFFDNTIEETTTAVTSPQVSTLPPDVRYRLHIKYNGERSIYVLLDGSLQACVQLQLDPNGQQGVRKYEVSAADTGEITRIRASYSSQCSDADANVDNLLFVSIYKEDTGEFYIERFQQDGGSHPTPIRGRPCKRQFERQSNKKPYSYQNDNEYNEYSDIIDETECQLKCIEEEEFNCQIAYYSSQHKSCYVFMDVPLNDLDSSRVTASLFQRTDNCSTEI
ncbi:uncharacterized protein LOC123556800 isoform X3 [Mercenaria mercenaria]|uniref:uncharacterized protein LOC123556800 isoform X3 n=1 Tax=Mercenaria mercenaria TaxID=6596 RepID=UPI00234E57D1|nr:uncharacterized protein LOC123556800 isoform X3 [Mercenaria mercenaria]